MSDFVVDVHNVARRVLTTAEFVYFRRTYFEEYLLIGDDYFFAAHLQTFLPRYRAHIATLDSTVRTKVGEAFIQHGLYPFSFYMNNDDIDVRKRFEL